MCRLLTYLLHLQAQERRIGLIARRRTVFLHTSIDLEFGGHGN